MYPSVRCVCEHGAHVEEAKVLTVLTALPEHGPMGVSYGAHSPSLARPCGVLKYLCSSLCSREAVTGFLNFLFLGGGIVFEG